MIIADHTAIHCLDGIHRFGGHDARVQCAKRDCGAARRMYIAALYQMPQALFSEAPISATQADKVIKQTQRETYQRLPSVGAQRTTQVLGDNRKGWLAAKKNDEKHPQKCPSRLKLPNYARAAKTYVVGRNSHKIEQDRLFPAGGQDFGFQPLKAQLASHDKHGHIST